MEGNLVRQCSDVPWEVYQQYKDDSPELKQTSEHCIEFDRVGRAEARRRGDLEQFGRLIFESGRSSIETNPKSELIKLYEIMTQTQGIYGGFQERDLKVAAGVN